MFATPDAQLAGFLVVVLVVAVVFLVWAHVSDYNRH